MNFDHCVFEAAQRALDMEDVPDALLPLVIVSELAHLSGVDSETMGSAVWQVTPPAPEPARLRPNWP